MNKLSVKGIAWKRLCDARWLFFKTGTISTYLQGRHDEPLVKEVMAVDRSGK